jgi:hypothetical protein
MPNPELVAYADAQAAYNEAINKSIDAISADVARLKAKIAELDARPPGWTPEDQTIVDSLTAQATALADKVKALDDATEEPPVVPPVE